MRLCLFFLVLGCAPHVVAKGKPMQTGSEPFTLDVHSFGGPDLGSGVHERDSRLIIAGRTGLARYEQHRSEAETPGESIGRFARALSQAEVDALETEIRTPAFAALRATRAKDVTATIMVISAQTGEKRLKKLINTRDLELVGQLEPLLFNIGQLEGGLLDHPVAAIRVVVRRAGPQFELVIENISREPVTLADPRFLEGTADDWAGVRIAAVDVPDTMFETLHWSRLKLERPLDGKPADVRIEPGASFVAKTDPWHRGAAGSPHVAQAIVSSYRGPAFDNPYRVRGAAFSEIIDVP